MQGRCLLGVPSFLRDQFRPAVAHNQTSDHALKWRGWKFFSAHIPHVVCCGATKWTKQSKVVRRVELFKKKDWVLQLEEAKSSAKEAYAVDRKLRSLLHQGEVSRARQVLCSQARAPGTSATLNELRDPELRPSGLSEGVPLEVSRFWPHNQFQFDREKCACNFRSVLRGSAAGLAGDTNEHLNVLLNDEETTLLVSDAAEHLCIADFPGEIADSLDLGALAALLDQNGSTCGIVTPSAEEWHALWPNSAKKFEEARMPF